jgi:hypothetical protein
MLHGTLILFWSLRGIFGSNPNINNPKWDRYFSVNPTMYFRTKYYHIVTCMGDCRRGLDWWLDLFTTLPQDSELQVITITATNTKSSPACSIFTCSFLVRASNSGGSSASALTPFQAGHRPTTELTLAYNISVWTIKKHGVFNNTSIGACVYVAAGTCLQSICLESAVVDLLIAKSLNRNGYTRYNVLPLTCGKQCWSELWRI